MPARLIPVKLVEITLDAVPGETFTGKVTKKGTLARKKDYNSKINVFDVEVTFQEINAQLKPGMSAACNIIVDRLEDVVSVPLEAVFEKEGKPVVYLKNKKDIEVVVGRRNDMVIEIVEGLKGDEEICLVDPTLDEQGLPGDKATEPELNKSPSSNSSPKPGGRPGRRGR